MSAAAGAASGDDDRAESAAANEGPRVYEYLWAKQSGVNGTYPLAAHLLDTASVAHELFRKWLRPGLRRVFEEELGPQAGRIVALIAGIHDVGKGNPLFQWQPTQRDTEWDTIRAAITDAGELSSPSPRQQEKWHDNPDFRRHERVTALHLAEDVVKKSLGEAWSVLPGLGHHGFFSVPLMAVSDPERARSQAHKFLHQSGWYAARESMIALVAAATGVDMASLPQVCSPRVSLLLSGLTVLADRLASSEEWVARSQEDVASGALELGQPRAWFERQSELAVAYIENNIGIYQGWTSTAEAARDILAGRDARPMQRSVAEAGEGLVTVMAPTGSGKTEAALLRHAQRDERLIFLLPTQATTNALMRRVQRAFQNTPNVASLAHGMASVEDFYDTPVTAFDDHHDCSDACQEPAGLFPKSFVQAGMSRLLASVCVGTVDQALKAGLKVKWVHLLLLALANGHVVIDEVHTLDHYQTELLKTVLTWLGALGTRVTLLTATFPGWQYTELYRAYTGEQPEEDAAFPAVVDRSGRGAPLDVDPYEVAIKYRELDLGASPVAAHVEWVKAMRREFPDARLGVICNRVRWAQEVALALRDEGHEVIVLHSAMTSAHRQGNAELLEKLLGPSGDGRGVTVVGTQAIEASLDIDLDLLSTDLCPSASLIQRAGRVWRRADAARPSRVPGIERKTVRVVDAVAANEHARYPYRLAELQRTAAWVRNHERLCVPDDCQDFVDASSVTWADIARGGSDAELDQYAEDGLKRSRGHTASYDMRDLLEPGTSVRELSRLFGKDTIGKLDVDQLRTRDIEEESVQVLIASEDTKIPGAWRGDAQELRAIRGSQREQVRAALAASMPLRRSYFESLEGVSEDLSESKSPVARYRLLHVGDLYDPLVGFMGWRIGQQG